MKPILMYGKKTVVFSKVISKLLSEERKLGGEKKSSLQESALAVEGWKKKKNSMKSLLDVWAIWARQEELSKK